VNDVREKLDADIYLVDDDRLEIRKYYPREVLETTFAEAGGRLTSYDPGVSKATAEEVKQILENKINTLGTKDAKVNPLTGLSV
jgi:hypothetical protein